MLAQLQGDYAEAERRYHQSLAIREQLSNQDGIASTLSQLGILHTDIARPVEAIAYHLRALTIRLAIGAPQVGIDLTRLHRLRTVLGERAFAETARQYLNDDAYANLSALLEQLPSLGLPTSDPTLDQVLHISTLDVARVSDASVPVPALCGKYWVPFDDPLLPTCPECEAIIDANLDFAAVDMDSQPDRTETIGRPLHGLYAEDRRQASGASAIDPLGGVRLTDVVATAIHSALNSCTEKELLDTCAILLSLMEADAASNWDRINLYFPARLSEARRGLFPDPPLGIGGRLKGTLLTVSCARALRTASRISLQFSLSPMPTGVLALGLAANVDSGACRALGIVNPSEQDELIRLIQEDLLQVHLGGLNLSDLDMP
jgi:tetratricopeptide (TPR) repeat protein